MAIPGHDAAVLKIQALSWGMALSGLLVSLPFLSQAYWLGVLAVWLRFEGV